MASSDDNRVPTDGGASDGAPVNNDQHMQGQAAKSHSSAAPKAKASSRRAQSSSSIAHKPRKKTAPRRPWDDRFQLLAVENDLLPRPMRKYFSRPASLPELKQELVKKNSPRSVLKRLDSDDEVPWTQPTQLSADAWPPPCPGRHVPGGSMVDRLGNARPWNNRWQVGVHVSNEYLHPVQRSAFSQKSPLEYATSQKWRRYHEVEAERGVWISVEDECPPRFPPMGA
mmetsp:Transcript_48148/g.112603  ORF Transcript_48148/g.112603 Transcript_48148/m.112603 type:complete len:227 (-) Transcript_48148:26-706(-)